jgi:2Fe-2S ferredoxin
MNENKKEITITIIHDGREHLVKTFANEYRNLMVLLNNTIYLESFGECGGQGRCATCLVKITGLNGNANLMERNEKMTITKTGFGDLNTRLSCQLLINADLENAVIEITNN